MAGCIRDPLSGELVKIAQKFESDPKIKALGYGDPATAEWLWNKYVGTPRNPNKLLTQTEIKKYKAGIQEFIDNIGRPEGAIGQLFKLPKALMRKLPESSFFSQEMSNATSFRQKHLKESAIEINKMVDGLYKMMLSGDYGGVFTKKQLKEYQNLERDLEAAQTVTERMDALKKVTDYIGTPDSKNMPIAGKVLRRFNDLLTFKEIPKEGTIEEVIVENWNELRLRSAKSLLNGIEQAKAIIKTVPNPHGRKDLVKSLDLLQAAAERIHFQQNIDAQTYVKRNNLFDITKSGQKIEVYDSKTGQVKPYKMIDAEGKRVIPRELTKYAPEYVIELANVVRNVTDYAANPSDVKWNNKSPDQIRYEIEKNLDLGNMINRLKARTDVNNGKFASLDPIFTLNKYIHDIAHFNYATRVNLAYKKATDKFLEIARKRNIAPELGEYARQMGSMIAEIRNSALNNFEGAMPEMDNLVRTINAFEYISKLGWSVRGALRNRSQMLFDWVRYGAKGLKQSNNFYDKLGHQTMANTEMNRFGILFGEKAAAASTAIATAGSIESITPSGTLLSSETGLVRVKEGTGAKIARGVSGVAEKSAVTLQIAENANRKGTFKRAFALSFMGMEANREYWKREYMEKRNLKKAPDEATITEYIQHKAGNAAANAVRDLHFEYDKWAKAKVLQTQTGKVLGQFQTYRFALWDMQWQMLKDAKRGVKAGKYGLFEVDAKGKPTRIMPEIQQAMRYLSLYSWIVPLASFVGNADFGNLIQNETYDTFQRFFNFYTLDPDDPEQLEDKYGQFFGKGALAGNLGPFVSDVLTVADLFDFYSSTPEELQETMKMKYDPNDPEWWYKFGRIFSIQGSRTAWHTSRAFLKDNTESMWRVETGLYKPKHIYDWMSDSDDAAFKRRRNWLDNSPYSPINLIYTGEALIPKVGGPVFPKIKKKRKKNKKAISVLEGMLLGK